MSKGRLEAFSDGVFAITITIMVLEMKVAAHASDLSALFPLLPVARLRSTRGDTSRSCVVARAVARGPWSARRRAADVGTLQYLLDFLVRPIGY
jgi:hypothetical protein